MKASNVLLDDKWVAKVADFGTARIFNDESGTRSSVVIGTRGYIAPEYLRNAGDLTLKCDVYSFGVTLLSTISGVDVITAPMFLRNARGLWGENNIMNFPESQIEPPSSIDIESEIRMCIRIGILCIQETPDHRPTMPKVVELLTNSSAQVPPLNSCPDLPNNQEIDQPPDPEAGADQHNQVTREMELTSIVSS
ncbi:unnamed protein product [Urochloa humidicola]